MDAENQRASRRTASGVVKPDALSEIRVLADGDQDAARGCVSVPPGRAAKGSVGGSPASAASKRSRTDARIFGCVKTKNRFPRTASNVILATSAAVVFPDNTAFSVLARAIFCDSVGAP